jgi:hypothetical protein
MATLASGYHSGVADNWKLGYLRLSASGVCAAVASIARALKASREMLRALATTMSTVPEEKSHP